MKKLNLEVIRLDGDTQPREKLDDDRVDLYAENMKDGDKFPPLTVHYDSASYWLSSGFHRYFAAKKIGLAGFECEIILGTVEDARIYACGANARGGLTPTPADNRLSVMRLLEMDGSKKWSTREMARHIGISAMTVNRIINSLKPKAQKAPEAPPKARQGKDQKPAATETITPVAPPPKAQEPATEMHDERDHRIAELIDTVNELSAENQRLKDAIAIGQWDASEIEKIDVQDTLADLREQIRVLEIDNAALRDSRDMFQARNAELMKSVKVLQSRLKKLETA